jgi:hypothetical protein
MQAEEALAMKLANMKLILQGTTGAPSPDIVPRL